MHQKLTDAEIRRLRPQDRRFKVADAGGLYIAVTPTGSKLWRYKYRINGSEKLLALGRYPDLSLQEAREKHRIARSLVAQGIDPAARKKADRISVRFGDGENFKAIAKQWVDEKRKTWSAYYAKQVETYLENDVFKLIGDLRIRDVTTPQLFGIVKRVEARDASSAAVLIRQWCFAIFRYAIQRGAADQNPARDMGDSVTRVKVRHKHALSDDEISRLLNQISESNSTPLVKAAVLLLMLTFVRPSELRNATWAEFDLASGMWRIPAERMKMREPHIVPLSTQAMFLLSELRRLSPNSRQQLFPNSRDPHRNMSMTTMNRMLERLGWAGIFSAHGFRATASTFFNENAKRYRAEAIERQLAHRESNKVRKAYNHAQYLNERVEMMQDWADHLDHLRAR